MGKIATALATAKGEPSVAVIAVARTALLTAGDDLLTTVETYKGVYFDPENDAADNAAIKTSLDETIALLNAQIAAKDVQARGIIKYLVDNIVVPQG